MKYVFQIFTSVLRSLSATFLLDSFPETARSLTAPSQAALSQTGDSQTNLSQATLSLRHLSVSQTVFFLLQVSLRQFSPSSFLSDVFHSDSSLSFSRALFHSHPSFYIFVFLTSLLFTENLQTSFDPLSIFKNRSLVPTKTYF